MTLNIEHPRALVVFLCLTVLVLSALLEYDNRVLEANIIALRYCLGQGVSTVR